MRYWLILAIALFAAPVAAQEACPAPPDRAVEKAELLRQLRLSRDATEAQLITGDLWRIWTLAPDGRAQALLDGGMALLRRAEYDAARAVLGELVAYCPDYAEGWNQRAFAAYLAGDFAAALTDLDHALALDPAHVPALSGKGLTLIGLGRDDEAQIALRDAVRMNPWLSERSLLRIPLGVEL